jgi:hypothetical protein
MPRKPKLTLKRLRNMSNQTTHMPYRHELLTREVGELDMFVVWRPHLIMYIDKVGKQRKLRTQLKFQILGRLKRQPLGLTLHESCNVREIVDMFNNDATALLFERSLS